MHSQFYPNCHVSLPMATPAFRGAEPACSLLRAPCQAGGPDVSILSCVPADSVACTGGAPHMRLPDPRPAWAAPSTLPLAHELLVGSETPTLPSQGVRLH